MHFSASQLLTVVLAGVAAASPSPLKKRARSAVIGFRTVAKGEADHIAEWGGTFVDEFDVEAFKDPKAQTGLGKYLTPSPGEWPGNLVPNPRYCVIWADEGKYNSAAKIWIPEDHWWPQSEEQMADYIKSQGMNPDRTLRYSKISGKEHLEQLMIPYGMFNQWADDDSIDIEAECFDSVDKLKEAEGRTASYDRNDIKGKNGPAHPTPPNPAEPNPKAPPPPPGPPGPPGA